MLTMITRYFAGEFEHTIDSVNRLVIPSKWRTGESEELYVFPSEGRLAVLPRAVLDMLFEEIRNALDMSPAEKRERKEDLFHRAVQMTCDKQGRITMDAKLMKHALLKSSVILVGGGERFAIWDPQSWQRCKETRSSSISATMTRFGI